MAIGQLAPATGLVLGPSPSSCHLELNHRPGLPGLWVFYTHFSTHYTWDLHPLQCSTGILGAWQDHGALNTGSPGMAREQRDSAS